MCRTLFLAYQNCVDICLENTVIEGTDRHTGIAEYILDPLRSQTFYHSIRTVHMPLLSGSCLMAA